jgi:hypothetical protein
MTNISSKEIAFGLMFLFDNINNNNNNNNNIVD